MDSVPLNVRSGSVSARQAGMFFLGFRSVWAGFRLRRAGVAQLVEHLICNQRVGGSNPFASSTLRKPEIRNLDGEILACVDGERWACPSR